MKKIIITTLFTLFCLSSLNADDTLYKNYKYGMNKSELLKEANIYDCSADFLEGALCKDNQEFVGEKVDLGFTFINDKLVSVTLFTNFTTETYIKFFGAIKSKFQLILIENNQDKLDFLVQMKKYKKSQFLKNVSDFEKDALNNGYIKYSFIDNDVFTNLVKSSDNAVDMVLKAKEDVRVVEYEISESENVLYAGITFALPKKTLLMINQKKKYENF